MYAWIDEQDCFGTLAEIGWAAHAKKHVGIGFGPNLTRAQRMDFWFVQRFANLLFDGLKVEDAFALFLASCGAAYEALRTINPAHSKAAGLRSLLPKLS